MTKYKLDYYDHDLEAVQSIEFTASADEVRWQLGENANKFFVIDTHEQYLAIPLTDIKAVKGTYTSTKQQEEGE